MRKGKFGIVLCFYPIAAFVAAILAAATFQSPVIATALVAAVIFLEKDEWAARQTLQAWMLSALAFFVHYLANLLRLLPQGRFFSGLFNTSSTVLSILIAVVTIVFAILGIIRVRKEDEANIPLLAELAYHAYGKVKPKPVPQYPQPYNPGMPPMQQPMPPQGQYPPPYMQQGQPMPQQYTPPMSVPEQPAAQPPQPGQPNGPQA